MQHPDEGTIHAWLDGALTPSEASEVEAHTASCAQCRDAVAEARGLIAASSRIVSALDAVPAGVIPARRRATRPWYASTQLRAAAAVLFVAGASMLLINRPDSKSLSELTDRATSAPAPQVAESDAAIQLEQAAKELSSTSQSTGVERPAVKGPEGSAKRAVSTETRAASDRDEAGRVGSAARTGNALADAAPASAPAPAPITAPAPVLLTPPPAPPVDSVRATTFSKSIPVSPVVVTGVATGVQEVADDLRILGVDSTSGQRVTRYRIATGAEVVLTEVSMSKRGATARERRFDAVRGPAPPPPPPVPAAAIPPAVGQAATRAEAAMQARVETLTWADAETGKIYTLSGRVPRETLEQVRARLQLPKR